MGAGSGLIDGFVGDSTISDGIRIEGRSDRPPHAAAVRLVHLDDFLQRNPVRTLIFVLVVVKWTDFRKILFSLQFFH